MSIVTGFHVAETENEYSSTYLFSMKFHSNFYIIFCKVANCVEKSSLATKIGYVLFKLRKPYPFSLLWAALPHILYFFDRIFRNLNDISLETDMF